MLHGGLGGLVATVLLWGALGWLSRDLSSSDLIGSAALSLPGGIAVLLITGGMVVGVVGSLLSLSRLKV
jgi:hypothetical protein